ncbi:MAG TPA: Re/Si-specific NAD(P)(+) transhydrogenase subunit alpha [Polyangiaceae bacterium]|nr:Re/Si-specific NAD(P)(+) transhydrogenase subunit alpha [Polyangiaceae bacterium]
MKVAIPRELHPGERRVAATPDTVTRLRKLGFDVLVEAGAGAAAQFDDAQYAAAGAQVLADAAALWGGADVVLKVRPPELREVSQLREGATLISFIWPTVNKPLLDQLATRKANVLAMDQIPRITRAQKLDALSSMANIAGYRAVIEAASHFGRFFTGQITAAGKVPPAKVLVIGAGVAGLAAIGAANSLGAIVRAFDTRAVVKEQVQSMGAEFLELDFEEEGSGAGGYAKEMSPAFIAAEMALFRQQMKEVDVVITTALIPGRPAPRLLPKEVAELLKPGSVVVDLAAEAGGNCELTVPGECVVKNGVTVIGFTDLPSRMAPTASQLYGTNLVHLLTDLGGNDGWQLNLEDEVVRGALVMKAGEILPPPPKAAPPPAPAAAKVAPAAASPAAKSPVLPLLFALLAGCLLFALGSVAPPEFLAHFTVFVLACFIGWQVVWNVTPALHTPLMSVTNAISGIILLGGMLKISGPLSSPVTVLAAVAVLVATINVSGGFLVTQRMLAMFRK